MTFENLTQTMVRWGFEIKAHHYKAFQAYLEAMLTKDRVIVIRQNGQLEAIVFYFLTEDYSKLYKKSTWEIAKDDPEGHQIYIDKMVCRRWTKELRQAVKRAIELKFPHVQEAYYHRAPIDRCVKISRETGVLCS